MSERLRGKVALITGAAGGQGAAAARLFASEGASLMLTDLKEEAVQALAEEISAHNGNAVALGHDVANEDDWKSASAEVERVFGSVNVLVNNAGLLSREGLTVTPKALWDQMIAINQTGTWLGMKYIVPLMRRTGSGSVINISSIYGMVGSGGAVAYHATKAAIHIMTKSAAVEYATEGIRFNSVHPGIIDTEMTQDRAGTDADRKLMEKTPMGRKGKPEEVAQGVLFLASDESSFVTGSELVIDGGYTAQ